MSNCQLHEVAGRDSEPELQVGENLNTLKGLYQDKIIKNSAIVGLFWHDHYDI